MICVGWHFLARSRPGTQGAGRGVENGERCGRSAGHRAEGAAYDQPAIGKYDHRLDLVVQHGTEAGDPFPGRDVERGEVALLDTACAVRVALHVAEVPSHVHDAVGLREI